MKWVLMQEPISINNQGIHPLIELQISVAQSVFTLLASSPKHLDYGRCINFEDTYIWD